MQIEQLPVDILRPYEKNAKLHPPEQVEQIAESISAFGFNDPIAVDENNMIIEGHGRLLAAKELGMETVPCLRLTGMTEAQKKAYILVHNQLTMETGFDFNVLDAELARIRNIDMAAFDFGDIDVSVEDFGSSFTLNSSDAPLVRTISMSLTPEQFNIWMQAIQDATEAGIIKRPSALTNPACNAIAAIVHEWVEGNVRQE